MLKPKFHQIHRFVKPRRITSYVIELSWRTCNVLCDEAGHKSVNSAWLAVMVQCRGQYTCRQYQKGIIHNQMMTEQTGKEDKRISMWQDFAKKTKNIRVQSK